jgi:hypothetical protein
MAATTDETGDLTGKGSSISETGLADDSTTDLNQMRLGTDEKNSLSKGERRDVEREQQQTGPSQHHPPAESPSDQQLRRVATPGEDYSVLTVTQKKLIITIASFASLFSPMATAIYCPYPTFSHSSSRSNFIRSITGYNIKGPQCIKFED